MFITTTLNHSNLWKYSMETSALNPTLRGTMSDSATVSPVHPPIHTKMNRVTYPDVSTRTQESVTVSSNGKVTTEVDEVTVYDYNGRTVEVRTTKDRTHTILDALV